MHLPDGFLDAKTTAVTWALGAGGVAFAARHASAAMPRERVPLVGLAAAFVFAAQMINFPVAGGTSGHLLGGVLVAALLGPGAAVIVLTAVLTLQCLLFADGGVTALGANVVNMALVGTLGGWAVFRAFSAIVPGRAGRLAGVAVGSWTSVVLSATTCAGQLAGSGTVRWGIAFPAMAGIHAVIGLGEAAIAAMVWTAIARARPELVGSAADSESRRSVAPLAALGLAVALALALFAAPFACPWPDGLEKVAEILGFESRASGALPVSPFPDYLFPGISSERLATAAAGALGTIVLFGVGVFLAWRLGARTSRSR
ncbi:MAG: energy-coupling factor ABC transporter permease [Verrucomicrobiae bacterium]|nr:energy-coupling factor ABC transporter permease [Verrucomicrobiae bacterium]